MSTKAWSRVDEVLRRACGTQFTAAVARVEQCGKVRFERAYGSTRTGQDACRVYVDTRFDLASLTKLFVATLCLRAVQHGAIALDGSLLQWFPEWRDMPHGAISARMLLAHNSGMNSGADYTELFGKDIAAYALRRDLVSAPGTTVIYSDLGFIALGELLQRMYGAALQAQMQREDACRSLARTAFRPPQVQRHEIPATEFDAWRGRVQGFVHDEKAYLMGGVAGHAGLFGTAQDVAQIAEEYLGALHGRPSLLDAGVAREAIREQAFDPILRRGLGWALKTSDDNSCGRHFGPDTFGHTGFVGTSVWVDPNRDCSGTLLTNAVYFGRNDIRDLRAAFYEAVIEELDGSAVAA